MLLDDYPDTFTLVQIHPWDAYTIDWGADRATFYGVGGTPSARFDGVLVAHGAITNTSAMYDWYEELYLERLAVPADVTIELSARAVDSHTYDIHAEVCMEAGGTPKWTRIYLVQVLDNWPASPAYSRHTLKAAADTQDFTLSPGRCKTVDRTFAFDGDSMSHQNDIKIIAWAQDRLSSGPAEVYQAAVMNWPFPQSPMQMEWVTVGDPGNDDDTHGDGYGGVAYPYRIGKYEVTNAQYAEFLNAVAAVGDANSLYSTDMAGGWNDIGGISRTGSGTGGDPWVYAARSNRENRPVNYVNWYDTLRFANWLHNGQPTGTQDASTTEDGAYDMSQGAGVVRKPGALVFLPSEDEWYKAAYYKGGGTSAGYWDYPTRSDTAPTAEAPPGTDPNGSANYYTGAYVDPTYYTTPVGAYTTKPSDSAYETYDQGGNVWEWNEWVSGSLRGLRGGSWGNFENTLRAETRNYYDVATYEDPKCGFRVASLVDCNGNGIPDICDISCGETDGFCDVSSCGLGFDCDGNGILDECDTDNCPVGNPVCSDCNWNYKLDACDIADCPPGDHACDDCNVNGVPDQCDLDPSDPDRNGEVSRDCNANVIPDECDIDPTDPDGDGEVSPDCNANEYPDWCDMTGGGVLLDEDFEDGLPDGWAVTGVFRITGQCGASHPYCGGALWAYAGNTGNCSYADNMVGRIILPPVTLGVGVSEVRFCSGIETEEDWDFGRVLVDEVIVWEDSGGNGQWQERVADISSFAGQTVNIVFEFSADTSISGELGWLVDNITVVSGSEDCQENGVPDDCDVNPADPDENGHYSADSPPNGIPDECEMVAPVAPSASPDNVAKNRYVSFVPNSGEMAVAFEVQMTASTYFPEATGVVGWVGEPFEASEDPGVWIARLVDAPPAARVWTEAVVHVGDCAIVPAADYAVRTAVQGSAVDYSDPLAVATILQPGSKYWGDVVGTFDGVAWGAPDQSVGMDDVQAAIQKFQKVDAAPHLTWVDVDGQVPNAILNFTDIQQIVQGFKNDPYPFGCPPDDPCYDNGGDPANCP